MMINTFKFSKGLIISIIYIVIILTFVKCAGYGTKYDKNQPVPDYEPGGVNDKNYFQYHFRSTYPGRFKLSPKDYFDSKYGCPYIVLPVLEYIHIESQDERDEYHNYMYKMYSVTLNKYAERLLELQNISKSIINEENKFAQAIKNTYEATETAYITVHKNLQNNENKEEVENKNKAIEKYLKNQMSISTLRSTIPVKYEEIEFFYVINNYELYIDPTEEIFYRKEVITQEISALKKAIHSLKSKECPLLNESAFYEVTFLYDFLPNKDDECMKYEEMKILVALNLQEFLNDSKLTYTRENFLSPITAKDSCYENLCKNMKKSYVVGNENLMSYFVRLKAQGYTGIHQDLHSSLYNVNRDDYKKTTSYTDPENITYTIDMDLLQEDD